MIKWHEGHEAISCHNWTHLPCCRSRGRHSAPRHPNGAAAKNAAELAATYVVYDAFVALAVEVNLVDARGCWTESDHLLDID